jgi:hypothetical protein
MKPIQIDPKEWYYMGCFIQQQVHPKLLKYCVFQDTEEQATVGVCHTFTEAKSIAKANRVENPLHSASEYLY